MRATHPMHGHTIVGIVHGTVARQRLRQLGAGLNDECCELHKVA